MAVLMYVGIMLFNRTVYTKYNKFGEYSGFSDLVQLKTYLKY